MDPAQLSGLILLATKQKVNKIVFERTSVQISKKEYSSMSLSLELYSTF